MAVNIERFEDMLLVRIIGDIDHHNAKPMRESIDQAVIKGNITHLELDFRDVSFMDSSGIGLVMGRYKLMQEVGGSLQLQNIAGHLKKVMKLAGLDRLAILDGPSQIPEDKTAVKEDSKDETNQLDEAAV